LLKEDSKH